MAGKFFCFYARIYLISHDNNHKDSSLSTPYLLNTLCLPGPTPGTFCVLFVFYRHLSPIVHVRELRFQDQLAPGLSILSQHLVFNYAFMTPIEVWYNSLY